jgi:Cdc6-like AAA superfamily ATPase
MSDFNDFVIELNEKIEKSGVRRVFTPHAPVSARDLLFGRSQPLEKMLRQLSTPGTTLLLYGDRGVGKTSMAHILLQLSIISRLFRPTDVREIHRCSSSETLITVFHKLLSKCGYDISQTESSSSLESSGGTEVNVAVAKGGVSSKRSTTTKTGPNDRFLSPSTIADVICNSGKRGLFVIDEADAIQEPQVKYQIAEVAKLLSDANAALKLLIVGVANLSSELTNGHPSIGRCAVETKLHRIGEAGIRQIIDSGGDRTKPKMDFDHDVRRRIVSLSGGYPYFAHLIGLKCVEQALADNRTFIRLKHLPDALIAAVEESEQSLRNAFHQATLSSVSKRFRLAIQAAATFGNDPFSANDLRKKMIALGDTAINQSMVNNLFKRLVGNDHNRLLHRIRVGTYTFSDPRMPSYVKIVTESETHYPNK